MPEITGISKVTMLKFQDARQRAKAWKKLLEKESMTNDEFLSHLLHLFEEDYFNHAPDELNE